MRHRNFSAPFNTTPGIDQHESNHLPPQQSYLHMGRSIAPENSSSVSAADHTLRGGVHCESQRASDNRAIEYPPSSLSMEVQHLAPSFSGPHYDSYPHSSVTGSLSVGPFSNVGHGHVLASRYNQPPTRDVEGGLLNSTTISGRGSLKRKSPDISGASERGSSSRFYCAGSSSGSSQMLMEKPSADCHSMPPCSIAVPPYRGASLSIAGEESVRDVRRRYRLELEPNMARSHYLSHSSHHYHSTTRPANYSGQLPDSSNADATGPEWNCVPLYMLLPLQEGSLLQAMPMMIVDHTGYYGGSRNLVDQYRDMRLDIDSMSYEELLALEENIGTVSTGLSEDSMSKCIILQTEAKKNFHVPSALKSTRMAKSKHADCIKKWLLMKNICPICKTECSG